MEALRRGYALLRPGGVLCVQEPDMGYDWTSVESALWQQARSWVLETLTAIGANPRMGLSLFAAFREAGLPDPEMYVEAGAGGGAKAPVFGWSNVVEGMVPLMERLGIATAAEVEPATLQDRLRAEVERQNGTVVSPCLYAAWTRK
ncbi:hypothetical protein [Saccharopolyspora hordei]|uniref:Methyltransferase n=1 Tax=Saccharopolyspora hordei TaxID=1838 RepID=A0A853AUW6_9PSEU|nr:hypothetical protein [Saccharopolyspora hordei]NYI86439.1 hypothetical protein [Saccharopolyspora hordei]